MVGPPRRLVESGRRVWAMEASERWPQQARYVRGVCGAGTLEVTPGTWRSPGRYSLSYSRYLAIPKIYKSLVDGSLRCAEIDKAI